MIGSCQTVPVKYSFGARRVGREPADGYPWPVLLFDGRCVADYFFEAA